MSKFNEDGGKPVLARLHYALGNTANDEERWIFDILIDADWKPVTVILGNDFTAADRHYLSEALESIEQQSGTGAGDNDNDNENESES